MFDLKMPLGSLNTPVEYEISKNTVFRHTISESPSCTRQNSGVNIVAVPDAIERGDRKAPMAKCNSLRQVLPRCSLHSSSYSFKKISVETQKISRYPSMHANKAVVENATTLSTTAQSKDSDSDSWESEEEIEESDIKMNKKYVPKFDFNLYRGNINIGCVLRNRIHPTSMDEEDGENRKKNDGDDDDDDDDDEELFRFALDYYDPIHGGGSTGDQSSKVSLTVCSRGSSSGSIERRNPDIGTQQKNTSLKRKELKKCLFTRRPARIASKCEETIMRENFQATLNSPASNHTNTGHIDRRYLDPYFGGRIRVSLPVTAIRLSEAEHKAAVRECTEMELDDELFEEFADAVDKRAAVLFKQQFPPDHVDLHRTCMVEWKKGAGIKAIRVVTITTNVRYSKEAEVLLLLAWREVCDGIVEKDEEEMEKTRYQDFNSRTWVEIKVQRTLPGECTATKYLLKSLSFGNINPLL